MSYYRLFRSNKFNQNNSQSGKNEALINMRRKSIHLKFQTSPLIFETVEFITKHRNLLIFRESIVKKFPTLS